MGSRRALFCRRPAWSRTRGAATAAEGMRGKRLHAAAPSTPGLDADVGVGDAEEALTRGTTGESRVVVRAEAARRRCSRPSSAGRGTAAAIDTVGSATFERDRDLEGDAGGAAGRGAGRAPGRRGRGSPPIRGRTAHAGRRRVPAHMVSPEVAALRSYSSSAARRVAAATHVPVPRPLLFVLRLCAGPCPARPRPRSPPAPGVSDPSGGRPLPADEVGSTGRDGSAPAPGLRVAGLTPYFSADIETILGCGAAPVRSDPGQLPPRAGRPPADRLALPQPCSSTTFRDTPWTATSPRPWTGTSRASASKGRWPVAVRCGRARATRRRTPWSATGWSSWQAWPWTSGARSTQPQTSAR